MDGIILHYKKSDAKGAVINRDKGNNSEVIYWCQRTKTYFPHKTSRLGSKCCAWNVVRKMMIPRF
jgi:hypothetical protein